ncbi:TIGR01244 family sulfur transferase [Donghicola sp. XS_ASV15]|uniref:TIGR01244 family sulfur transferase n=1 Tax=Donghicola sp. XS_ASV15 TaxID=3241295 RepID=UPI003513970A
MDIRVITPTYSVTPQITPADIPAIADAGYKVLICNRPDAENPPQLWAEEIGKAAEEAGLEFHVHPVTHSTMTPEVIARHHDTLAAAPGPVLAYCASGTRCSVLWSFAMAKEMSIEDILAATEKAGYALGQLRPQLKFLAEEG